MPEWAYKNIKRGFLFEELMSNNDGAYPLECKFYMFNGTCKFIRLSGQSMDLNAKTHFEFRNTMSPDWIPLDVTINTGIPLDPPPQKPKQFEEMMELSKKLANQIDFIRVDLYVAGDRIIVGELTSYPFAGLPVFNPKSFDLALGHQLNLDNYGGWIYKFVRFFAKVFSSRSPSYI